MGVAAMADPGLATCQTFGQVLDSEIPLDIVGTPAGVRDRLRPELQPAPLYIAGIALAETLDTTLGSTSNVLGAQDQRRADGFAEWQPQIVAAVADDPDRSAQIVLNYDGKRFFNTPAKDQDGYHLGVSGQTGLGLDGTLFVSAFHQRVYEDQLAGSYPANGGGAVAIDQSRAQARLAQSFNRVALTGAVTYDWLDYHATVTTTGAVLPQSYRDDSVLRASARVDYTLLTNTALFVQASWRDTSYAANSAYADRSSRQWQVIGGLSADISGLIRLTAGLGRFWRRYAQLAAAPMAVPNGSAGPDFGKIAGFAWDVRGAYYLSPVTTLSLQAKREFVDANIIQSPGYEATTERLVLDHEFLRNLLLSASLGAEADRFRLIMRRDHLHDYAVWVDYWVSPHLLVKPRIEWLDRTSSGRDAGAHIPEVRTQLALSLRN